MIFGCSDADESHFANSSRRPFGVRARRAGVPRLQLRVCKRKRLPDLQRGMPQRIGHDVPDFGSARVRCSVIDGILPLRVQRRRSGGLQLLPSRRRNVVGLCRECGDDPERSPRGAGSAGRRHVVLVDRSARRRSDERKRSVRVGERWGSDGRHRKRCRADVVDASELRRASRYRCWRERATDCLGEWRPHDRGPASYGRFGLAYVEPARRRNDGELFVHIRC